MPAQLSEQSRAGVRGLGRAVLGVIELMRPADCARWGFEERRRAIRQPLLLAHRGTCPEHASSLASRYNPLHICAAHNLCYCLLHSLRRRSLQNLASPAAGCTGSVTCSGSSLLSMPADCGALPATKVPSLATRPVQRLDCDRRPSSVAREVGPYREEAAMLKSPASHQHALADLAGFGAKDYQCSRNADG